MKIEEEALKVASAKLRKLRLTDSVAVKDAAPPSKTVKSIFQDSLGGLYDDDAITYALRFGVRYYLEAVEQSRALDGATVCRQVNHFYVDGVCAECGSVEPPRQ
jgi:hypothetical protein